MTTWRAVRMWRSLWPSDGGWTPSLTSARSALLAAAVASRYAAAMARRFLKLSDNTWTSVCVGLLVGFVVGCFWRHSLSPCLFGGSASDVCCPASSSAAGSDADADDGRRAGLLSRRRDARTPPGRSGRLFVGVMTAKKYLSSRVQAAHETWATTIHGRVAYFSGADSSGVDVGDADVIALNNVDDSYPPQKKSFLMLKYMHDHFIDDYEWFMRADDDVYIKGDRLSKFLNSINSSVPQYIGQAGLGNKNEFGQLSLEGTDNFCMGGPGMIFSSATLRLVVPHISYCLQNLYTTHEDVEIGRCIKKFAGVSCTWAFQVSPKLFPKRDWIYVSHCCLFAVHTRSYCLATNYWIAFWWSLLESMKSIATSYVICIPNYNIIGSFGTHLPFYLILLILHCHCSIQHLMILTCIYVLCIYIYGATVLYKFINKHIYINVQLYTFPHGQWTWCWNGNVIWFIFKSSTLDLLMLRMGGSSFSYSYHDN